MKGIVALFMLATLFGCASTPSDFTDYEKQQAATVRLYSAGESAPAHQALGKVESNSCDSNSVTRYAGSVEEAELLLRLEAVRRGGNMVVAYSCATKAVDLVSNCWASKRCEGIAAKMMQ